MPLFVLTCETCGTEITARKNKRGDFSEPIPDDCVRAFDTTTGELLTRGLIHWHESDPGTSGMLKLSTRGN